MQKTHRPLPNRPRCRGCFTQLGTIPNTANLRRMEGVAWVTFSCQYRRRHEQGRCGQPTAVVFDHGKVRYHFADTFKALEADLDRQYGRRDD